MEKSLSAPLKSLSNGQKLVIVIVALVIGFLSLGTFNQTTSPDDFAVGIQTQPFIVLSLLAFAGGLLSFVSPCTLPVLTAYFAFAFQSDRSRIASNTLAFMFGLATTFSLFGAVGFAVGRVLLQNQQLILLVGGAAVLIFGVMSLLGNGFAGVSNMSGDGSGPSPTMRGSYLFGLTFAVGWSSCVGPILGSVLTLAAQTTSVWRGMMLLFIYTIGLGLPLLIVSTFFGRASRKSLFWRILRGKGWQWDTHMFVVAVVWALAIWRILVPLTEYAFRRFTFLEGQTFTAGHEIGLLVITLLGAALWVFTSPQERRMTVHLHTTQLVTGALFILIGIMMLEAQLTYINGLFQAWFAAIDERMFTVQEWLVTVFGN
jgi:cytochrome c-type biogenesis protein